MSNAEIFFRRSFSFLLVFNASSFPSSFVSFIISITSYFSLPRIPFIFFSSPLLLFVPFISLCMFSSHYSYLTQAYRPPGYDKTRLHYVISVLSLTVFTIIFSNLFIRNSQQTPQKDTLRRDAWFLVSGLSFYVHTTA
jgi:hypothetical protein